MYRLIILVLLVSCQQATQQVQPIQEQVETPIVVVDTFSVHSRKEGTLTVSEKIQTIVRTSTDGLKVHILVKTDAKTYVDEYFFRGTTTCFPFEENSDIVRIIFNPFTIEYKSGVYHQFFN
jgi:hypothetical protein